MIEALGSRGDGIAATPEGVLHVAGALPGETVLVERAPGQARGRLVAVEAPAPGRAEPDCPYVSACGGCVAQHMAAAVYGPWKRAIVAGALARAGLDVAIAPLVDAHGAGRRRLTLHVRFADGAPKVGFMAARSHDLVAIARCAVAEPALARAPEAARALAGALARAGKPLDVQVTATETGLDVDVRGHGPPDARERAALIEAAAAHDLARLSVHGDVLIERRVPRLTIGRASVVPPPGAFLQATRAGEAALAGLVLAACAGARRIADLFAGCGPFALRLAERAEVHALDADAAALAALDRARRAAPGLRPIATEPRDLFRRPLLAPELARCDAVVLDPPRAGAQAQARQLAASQVPVVASVSCDAGSFARDAAILVAGGYRLEQVTPVDQFRHGAHVELVGVFRRAPLSGRGSGRRR